MEMIGLEPRFCTKTRLGDCRLRLFLAPARRLLGSRFKWLIKKTVTRRSWWRWSDLNLVFVAKTRLGGCRLSAFSSHLLGASSVVGSSKVKQKDRRMTVLMEMIGLEPTTFWMPFKRSSQVSYIPVFFMIAKTVVWCQYLRKAWSCGRSPVFA